MWLQDLRLPDGQSTEYYDIVLSDRPAGGAWSPSARAWWVTDMCTEPVWRSTRQAQRSWHGTSTTRVTFLAYVSYRPAAGAAWTPAERVTPEADDWGMWASTTRGAWCCSMARRAAEVMAVRGRRSPAGAGRDHVRAGAATLVCQRRWRSRGRLQPRGPRPPLHDQHVPLGQMGRSGPATRRLVPTGQSPWTAGSCALRVVGGSSA